MTKANLLQLLKVLVFLLSVWLIYREFWINAKWSLFEQTSDRLLRQSPFFLILAFVMVWINWGLETIKWRFLMIDYEHLGLWESYKAILTGVFVSMFTPNRVGEFAGRIVYLKSAQKMAAVMTTMAGSLSQLICTVFFGLIGLLFIGNVIQFLQVSQAVLFLVALLIFGLLLGIFFNLSILYRVAERLGLPNKVRRLLLPFLRLKRSLLGKVLLLSLIRYMVFAIQYGILLKWVMVDLEFIELFFGVSLIFLIQTIVPTFAFSELTIRGAGAIQVFALYGVESPPILIAAYTLWVFNIFIPAISGGILFLTNRKDDIGF